MTERTWSPQQLAVFEYFECGSGNMVVRARAGTGKTTVIVEGINRAPEKNILLAAFNKSIATELKDRIRNPHGEAKTLHSLGYQFVRRYWENTRVDSMGKRTWKCVDKVCGEQTADEVRRLVGKLVGKAKEIEPLATEPEQLESLAYQFDCVPDREWAADGYDLAWVLQKSVDVLEVAARLRDGTCDFGDMIFLPVRNKWYRGIFDLTVIDECQDMGYGQILLALGASKDGGRIVVVGDDRQCLYAFRGAKHSILDDLKDLLKAGELGLTVTYRCPQRVVDHARRLVPDFSAHPTAPPGVIRAISRPSIAATVEVGDFVLSRTNAPIGKVCLEILRAGKRAIIQGRDIGQGLLNIIEKNDRGGDVPTFLEAMWEWLKKETKKAEKGKNAEARIERMEDQCATIEVLTDGIETVAELKARIESLFADEKTAGPRVVCSTVHRAKGLERERVFMLRNTLYPGLPEWYEPGSGEFRPERYLEEQNIEYVAVTRAKNELVWVEGA